MTDWYERQDELEPGMVFTSVFGIVRLDQRVPGDGTQWMVETWDDRWVADGNRIEPADLEERLPDDFNGLQPGP